MKIPIHSTTRSFPLALFTIFALALLAPSIFAQKTETKKKPAFGFEIVKSKAPPEVGITIEYFKLDHRTANKLIRRFAPNAANAKELRDILGEMTDKGGAELIETGWVRARNGQRAKTESIREDIDPTEYDPPEIPKNIGGSGAINTKIETKNRAAKAEVKLELPANQNQSKPMTPVFHLTSATPTAFETRNVGLTLEVDPVISADNKTIDLNLAPEIVTRLGDEHFTRPGFEKTARGIENISMPTFHTIKTTTQITIVPGNYFLFSLHTPHDDPDKRVIVLIKVDLFHAG